jgi:hypothetical protein
MWYTALPFDPLEEKESEFVDDYYYFDCHFSCGSFTVNNSIQIVNGNSNLLNFPRTFPSFPDIFFFSGGGRVPGLISFLFLFSFLVLLFFLII